MSLIGEILPSSHILLDLEVSSKKRLFEQAGLLLENEAGVARSEVFDCLFAREKTRFHRLGARCGRTARPIGFIEKGGRCLYPQQRADSFRCARRQTRFTGYGITGSRKCRRHTFGSLIQTRRKFSDKGVREQLMQAADAAGILRILTEE